MKKKTLFLLTKAYPFGMWEQYINSELEYLSVKFDKIIIYPNDYYSEDLSHPKKLPHNVEILNFNENLKSKENNSLSDYLYLFKLTIVEFFSTDDKKNFLKNFKWNLVNFWSQYNLAKLFSKYLKDKNYNVDDCIFYSYWFHKSAIFLSILKDKNVIDYAVSRAHSVDLYHNDWGLINNSIKVPPFKMFKLKHIDEIYTVSDHGRKYLVNKYPKYAQKISVNRLGVQIDTNANKKKDITPFHIVTCSDIDKNKRIHKLAEILPKINKPVHWTHFGSGKLLSVVEEKVKTFPTHITVDLKGRTPNHEVKNFYSTTEVNLFVNLSIVEGLPVAIMEALAFEIPVLATSVYGTPEAVVNNENGFLLDVNFSREELINKINFCIDNVDDLKNMGLKSRMIYLDKFNAEKNYTDFANHLISL